MQKDKIKIQIFDTTLRDGEQAAGSRLGISEKLEIARHLEKLNVDVIEAGFPISSPVDFDAVKVIAKEIRGPVICGLTRAVIKDIDVCAKALEGAEKSRIHTGIGVSDMHIMGKFKDQKYGKSLEEKRSNIIELSAIAVKHALNYTNEVEFYAEDAGRANILYLCKVVEEVIRAGAKIINIPDTTGYAMPEQFGNLICEIRKKVPNIDKAIISVHCHNDLGMAVANSLSAIKNGALQVEGTINGIGERAGNAAIEEIIMAIRTRKDYFTGMDCNINSKALYSASRIVAAKNGMHIPNNKAVVGHNAFSHSSGIHVDGFLKERSTYEILRPEDVGFPHSSVILTARTGRHGLRHRLSELGYEYSVDEFEQIYARFLDIADKKTSVNDDDIAAIVEDEIKTFQEKYKLVYIHAVCGTRIVQIEKDKFKVAGKGASTDIIEASAKAIIDGINKIEILRNKKYTSMNTQFLIL